MIKKLVKVVFGTQYDREMKKIRPIVEAIKQEEERLAGLSDDEIRGQTALFRARLAERLGAASTELEEVRAAKHGCEDPHERDRLETRFHELESNYKKALAAELDALLPEAFATVREAARRLQGTTVVVTGRDLTWDMVHYDVQLIGGIVLHQGKIAEMATGEGKTLVATLPLYLNALAGRGAHLVTVNNYLARRDRQWMGHLYGWLGLTVAVLDDTEPSTPERKAAYAADITYGTNNEFGFDYLRDNMVFAHRAAGPAPARLRHHRRGRLDPHRRGADPADHLGPRRQRRGRFLRPAQPPGGGGGPQADRRRQPAADRGGGAAPGRGEAGRRGHPALPGPPGRCRRTRSC